MMRSSSKAPKMLPLNFLMITTTMMLNSLALSLVGSKKLEFSLFFQRQLNSYIALWGGYHIRHAIIIHHQ
jgi:hypothetical protein